MLYQYCSISKCNFQQYNNKALTFGFSFSVSIKENESLQTYNAQWAKKRQLLFVSSLHYNLLQLKRIPKTLLKWLPWLQDLKSVSKVQLLVLYRNIGILQYLKNMIFEVLKQ